MKTRMSSYANAALLFGPALLLILLTSCGNLSDDQNTKAKKNSAKTEPPSLDLQAAAVLGDTKAVLQHIRAGSDLNAKDEATGSTPLITATVFGKTKVAIALIEAGADVNIQNYEGSTALHTAAFLCRTEIVSKLLENGADRNILNNYGSTALMSVQPPFSDVKFIYEQFNRDLGPYGLVIDYDEMEKTRPVIVTLLK